MHQSKRIISTAAFTLSGTSQASAAFGSQTYSIRIAAGDQPAYFKIGDGTPTATASDALLPAGSVDYLTVSPGQKIAVLQAGTAGSLSVSELG